MRLPVGEAVAARRGAEGVLRGLGEDERETRV